MCESCSVTTDGVAFGLASRKYVDGATLLDWFGTKLYDGADELWPNVSPFLEVNGLISISEKTILLAEDDMFELTLMFSYSPLILQSDNYIIVQ